MRRMILWSLVLSMAYGSVSCGLARGVTQTGARTLKSVGRLVTG